MISTTATTAAVVTDEGNEPVTVQETELTRVQDPKMFFARGKWNRRKTDYTYDGKTPSPPIGPLLEKP